MNKKLLTLLVAGCLCTCLPLFGQTRVTRLAASSSAGSATSQPAGGDTRKFIPTTPEQIQRNREMAVEMADKAKEFVKLRVLETDHYTLYTAIGPENDGGLKEAVERLYKGLCKQFDVPASQCIYAGKCPIFILADEKQITRFSTQVDKMEAPTTEGYQGRYGSFAYIVLRYPKTSNRFYEVLSHEGTHSFVGRYITNKIVPTWVDEGLADLTAATFVPGCFAERNHVYAAKQVALKGEDITHVFTKFREGNAAGAAFDYGVAQSLVRYLVEKDRKGFIKFITLMKEGKPEEDALKEACHMSIKELQDNWTAAVRRVYGRK